MQQPTGLEGWPRDEVSGCHLVLRRCHRLAVNLDGRLDLVDDGLVLGVGGVEEGAL